MNKTTFLELNKFHTEPNVDLLNYPKLLSFNYIGIGIIKSIINIPDELYELDCSHNIIECLDELGSDLTKLNCSSNKIDMFVKLDGLKDLEEVDLSDNKITEIGMNLSGCKNLRILNCSYNNINELPELNDQLEELYIHSNPLDIITHLPNELEIIGVDKNILSTDIVLSKNLLILS